MTRLKIPRGANPQPHIPQTLGDYAEIAERIPSPALKKYFADKIAAAPLGRLERVLADPSQMAHLMAGIVGNDIEAGKLGHD